MRDPGDRDTPPANLSWQPSRRGPGSGARMRPLSNHTLLCVFPPVSHGGGRGTALSFLLHFGSPTDELGKGPTRHCPRAKGPCDPFLSDRNFLETVRLRGFGERAGNRSKIKKNLLELCLPSSPTGNCGLKRLQTETVGGGCDPPCPEAGYLAIAQPLPSLLETTYQSLEGPPCSWFWLKPQTL